MAYLWGNCLRSWRVQKLELELELELGLELSRRLEVAAGAETNVFARKCAQGVQLQPVGLGVRLRV